MMFIYIFLVLPMTAFCMDEQNPAKIDLSAPFKVIRRPVPNVVEMDIGNYRYLVCDVSLVIISKCLIARRETKS